MTNPLEQGAFAAFGRPGELPPMQIFTPQAFRGAQTVADRAQRTRLAVQSSMDYLDREARIRDFMLKGQQQEVASQRLSYEQAAMPEQFALEQQKRQLEFSGIPLAAAEQQIAMEGIPGRLAEQRFAAQTAPQEQALKLADLTRREEIQAFQPALRMQLATIDPLDDDAEEKLAALEGYAVSPADKSRLMALRLAAQAASGEKRELLDRLRVLGDPEAAAQKYNEALRTARTTGDPMAFRKTALSLPEFNEAQAERMQKFRQAEQERQQVQEAMQTLRGIKLPELSDKGITSRFMESLAPMKGIPGFKADLFMRDPQAAIALVAAEQAKIPANSVDKTKVPEQLYRSLQQLGNDLQKARQALGVLQTAERKRRSAQAGSTAPQARTGVPAAQIIQDALGQKSP